ncbi:LURP-one-related protein [Dioscorea alata]|uniref:LURP-one-related protein n=1 Tax=Dioscorea alata TaxID=55571 RepID=A0ACB7V359_DIOAL|nr:LURP-one-related protein [Dioscorea alata]
MVNNIIVGEEYCKPEPIQLAFSTTIKGVKKKDLAITDLDGKALFWLSSDVASKKKWFILDAATGFPLLSIIKKTWSLHNRCQAFRAGEDTDEKNHLFTVKKSTILKIHKEWDVFLAANTEEVEWDFKITGEFSKRSIKVFHKQNPTAAIAEMSQHDTVVKVRLANDAFRVTISPNIDFAFIASLICTLHQFQKKQDAPKAGNTMANTIVKSAIEGAAGAVVWTALGAALGAASGQGTSSTSANNQETQEENDDDNDDQKEEGDDDVDDDDDDPEEEEE